MARHRPVTPEQADRQFHTLLELVRGWNEEFKRIVNTHYRERARYNGEKFKENDW